MSVSMPGAARKVHHRVQGPAITGLAGIAVAHALTHYPSSTGMRTAPTRSLFGSVNRWCPSRSGPTSPDRCTRRGRRSASEEQRGDGGSGACGIVAMSSARSSPRLNHRVS